MKGGVIGTDRLVFRGRKFWLGGVEYLFGWCMP